MIGLVYEEGMKISPFRRRLMKKPVQIVSRLICLNCGIVWINFTKPDIDYQIYLGQDWKKTYEGATTLIYNHATALVDIISKLIGYHSLIMA